MSVSTNTHSWDFYVARYEEASDLQNTLQNDVSKIESGNLQQIVEGYEDLAAQIAKNPIWADLMTPGSAAVARLASINQSVKTYLQSITIRVEDPMHPGQYINLYEGSSWDDGYGKIQEKYTGTSAEGGHPPANLYDILSGSCTSLFTDPNACWIPFGGSSAANWNGANGLNVNSEYKRVKVLIGHNPITNAPIYTYQYVGSKISASGSVGDWFPYINLSQGSDPSALNNALSG